MSNTLTATGAQMLGRFVAPGTRLQIVNTVTNESHWTGRITHFTTPKTPLSEENRRAFPMGVRIAWAGPTCLGPIPNDALVLVEWPNAEAV